MHKSHQHQHCTFIQLQLNYKYMPVLNAQTFHPHFNIIESNNSIYLPLEDLSNVDVAHLAQVLGVYALRHQVLHHLVPDGRQLGLLADQLGADVAAVVLHHQAPVQSKIWN